MAAIKDAKIKLPVVTETINEITAKKSPEENPKDYSAEIINSLKFKFVQKKQELEAKLPEIEAQKTKERSVYENKVNEATVEMLKQSPLQRILKLENMAPADKLNLISQRKLIPETTLKEITEANNGDAEKILKALKKKAVFNTRQITIENNDIRSISLYDKKDNHLEPMVSKKDFI